MRKLEPEVFAEVFDKKITTSGAENGIFNDMSVHNMADTDGRRNEEPLTDVQKEEVRSYAQLLGLPEDKLRITEHGITGYWEGDIDTIDVGTDVLPLKVRDKNPNNNISLRGTLAHEIIGHREAIRGGFGFDAGNVLDEVQASLRAAKLAPELSNRERNDLARDAMKRLIGAGINFRDVKNRLRFNER